MTLLSRRSSLQQHETFGNGEVMTATRTTRPPEPIDTGKTDKTAASHGCQWETSNNNIPSHLTIFHYHAHHHSLAPSHHHPSAYTYEPPVSVIIHHHPSLSVIIYQDWWPSIIIHFPFISIYHHPWSYIIVHRRPFIFIHNFLSWFINIYYHPPSSITHHHPSSSNNIHHDPLWTTIIHYHQSSSIMNHHHTSSIIIHHHSFIIYHQHSPIWPCFNGPCIFHAACLPVTFQVGKHEAELRSLQHRGAPKLRKSLEVVGWSRCFCSPKKIAASLVFFYQFNKQPWGEMMHQCEFFVNEV